MTKRIISLLLSIVMVISLLPVNAFAEEETTETPVVGEVTEGEVVEGEVVEGEVVEGESSETVTTVTVSTQEEFDAVITSDSSFSYLQADIIIAGDVTYTGNGLNLILGDGTTGKQVTIASGGSLTVACSKLYVPFLATVTVEQGGQLVMQSGGRMYLQKMGDVYVKSGGSLTASSIYVTPSAYLAADNAADLNVNGIYGSVGASFSSVVESLVQMTDVAVSSTEELTNAISNYGNYASVSMYVASSFTLTESVALPGNFLLSISTQYALDGTEVHPELTVANGVTLTVRSDKISTAWLDVGYGGLLTVEDGGTIVNDGFFYVRPEGTLTLNEGAALVGEVSVETGAVINDPSGLLNSGSEEVVRLFTRWEGGEGYQDSSEIYLNTTSPLVFCFGTTQKHIYVTDLTTGGVATLDEQYTAYDGAPCYSVGVSGLGDGTVSYTDTDGTVYTYSVLGMLGYPGDLVAQNLDGTGEIISAFHMPVGETVDVKFYQLDSYTTYQELPAGVAFQAEGAATLEEIDGGYRVGVSAATDDGPARIYYVDADKMEHSIMVNGYADSEGGDSGSTDGGDSGSTEGGDSGSTDGGDSGSTGGDSGSTEGGDDTGSTEGWVTVTTLAELKAALEDTVVTDIALTGNITLDADTTITASVWVKDGGSLTVPAKVTLTMREYLNVYPDSQVIVENAGTLLVDHGEIPVGTSYTPAALRVLGGTVRIDEGGTMDATNSDHMIVDSGALQVYGSLVLEEGDMVEAYYNNGAEIYGLDVENVHAYANVSSLEEINAAQTEYGTHGHLTMYAVGEFSINNYLLLITRATLVIDGSDDTCVVTIGKYTQMDVNGIIVVVDGGKLVADYHSTLLVNNSGWLLIREDGTVHIKRTATMINDGGKVTVYSDYNGVLCVDGDLASSNDIDGTVSESEYLTVEDYHAMMSAGNNTITVDKPMIFREQPYIYSDDPRITIVEGGSITLAEGVKWVVGYGYANITLDGGELILEKDSYLDYCYYGGTYRWGNDLWVNSGNLQVDYTATLYMAGDIYVNLDSDPKISGLSADLLYASKSCSTEEEVRTLLANEAGYANISVTMTEHLDLYEDLYIPETGSLKCESGLALHDGVLVNNWGYLRMAQSHCDIYSGAELQNNAPFSLAGNWDETGVTVHSGAKLLINDTCFMYSSAVITIEEGATCQIDGEIDDDSSGCKIIANGILSGSGTIPSSVTVVYPDSEGTTSVRTVAELNTALESGAAEIVIRSDMELTSAVTITDTSIRIAEGVVVTNNSALTLEDNSALIVDGTLINTQSVEIMGGSVQVAQTGVISNEARLYIHDGTVDVQGTWEGNQMGVNLMEADTNITLNAPDYALQADIYSYEDLLVALEKSYQYSDRYVEFRIYTAFTVENDLEIPGNVSTAVIGDEAGTVALTVSDGVTLTLHGPVHFSSAYLNVVEGGKLVNHREMSFDGMPYSLGGATFNGVLENHGVLWVNTGATVSINNETVSDGAIHVGFGEGQTCTLNIAGALVNYGYLNITPYGVVNVTGNLINNAGENGVGFIQLGGTMSVPGILTNNSGVGISVDGSLTVTGTYEGEGPVAVNIFNEGTVLSGVDGANMEYHYPVNNQDELIAAVAYAGEGHYDYLYIDVNGEVTVTDSITLPENVTLNNFNTITISGELIVSGVLINNSYIQVDADDSSKGLLIILESGTLHNNGAIMVNGGAVEVQGTYATDTDSGIDVDMNIGGDVIGNVPVTYGCVVNSYEELMAALEAGEACAGNDVIINIRSTVTLEEDLNLPDYVRLFVVGSDENDVDLIVPADVTLTLNAQAGISNAELIVQEGGKLVNHAGLDLNFAEITIDGELENHGAVGVNNGSVANINGYAFSDGAIFVGHGEQGNSTMNIAGELTNVGYMEIVSSGTINITGGTLNNDRNDEYTGHIQVRGVLACGGTIHDNGMIVIDGGHLLLDPNGILNVNNTELRIEENGGLTVNNQLNVVNSGIINNGQFWVNTNSVANIDEGSALISYGAVFVGFGPEDEEYESILEIHGVMENYGYFQIEPKGSVSIHGNLFMNFDDNHWSFMSLNGVMEVYGEMHMNTDAHIPGTLYIPGALFNNCNMTVDGGNLDVAGNYEGGGTVTQLINNESTVNVPEYANVRILYRADSLEGLKEAIDWAPAYGWLDVDVVAGFELDGDLEIPHNVSVILCENSEEPVCVTVPAGVTLTNHGNIHVNRTATLDVQSGAVLNNHCGIRVNGGTVIVNGEYVTENESMVDIELFEGGEVFNAPFRYQTGVSEFGRLSEALMIAAELSDVNVAIDSYNGYHLEGDITIPENTTLYITNCSTMVIPGDVTVTNNGIIEINNESVLVNEGTLENNGSLIVRENCVLENVGVLNGNAPEIYLDGGNRVVYNESDLIAALESEQCWAVTLRGAVTLTSDLNVPESKALFIDNGGLLTVPAGRTMTVEYSYVGIYTNGLLHVEEGAVLNNMGCIEVSGGALQAIGEYIAHGEIVNYLSTEGSFVYVNGDAYIRHLFIAESYYDLIACAAIATQYEHLDIDIHSSFKITGDITIPENVNIGIYGHEEEPVELAVRSGATLTLNGHIHVGQNAVMTVMNHATLVNNRGIHVDGGTVNVIGEYTSDNNNVITLSVLGGEVINAPYEYYAGVHEYGMLCEVLAMAQEVAEPVWIDICSGMEISEDMVIPANVVWNPTNGSDTFVIIPEGVTVTNYGRILVASQATLVVDGVVDNQGSVEVYDDSFLVVNGEIQGNAPGEANLVKSFEDLVIRINRGETWNRVGSVLEIPGDWTLEGNWGLELVEGGEIVVPSGVTLVIDGEIAYSGGGITVQEGGCLVNNSHTYIGDSGFIHVDGAYVGNAPLYVVFHENVSVYGIDNSLIRAHCMLSTEEDLSAAMNAGYEMAELHVVGDIVLTSSQTLSRRSYLVIDETGSLTVADGAVLTLEENVDVYGGKLIVAEGGQLINNRFIYVDSGEVNVAGTYSGEGGLHAFYHYGLTTVNGIDPSMMEASIAFVADEETLHQAMESGYAFVYVYMTGNITLTRDLTIPEDYIIRIADTTETAVASYTLASETESETEEAACASIIVPENVTLTVVGTLYNDGNLIVEEGGELVNEGGIVSGAGSVLDVNGTYSGEGEVAVNLRNGTVVEGIDNSGIVTDIYVANETELMDALNAGYAGGNIFVVGEVILTQDVTIPEEFVLYVFEGGSMTVSEGGKLTVAGQFQQLFGAYVSVEAGATMEILEGGFCNVQEGILVVDENASFIFHENVAVAWMNSEIIGVDPSQLILNAHITNTDELECAVEEGKAYAVNNMHVDSAVVVLDQSVTLPENVILNISGTSDGYANFIIPENMALVNYGTIEVNAYGVLVVMTDGTLNNYGEILVNDGKFILEEGSNLWGDEPVDGTVVNVAKIGDVEYATVTEALANAKSGDTVQLVADAVVEGTVTLPVGVTLDLGAYTLTADYVIGFKGSYLTATPNAGKLIVAKDNIILGQNGYVNEKGQYILPIWDPALGCYQFSLFVVNTANAERGLFIEEETETIFFRFKHQATGALNKPLLGDGASDNALSIIIRLEWETENGIASQDFYYNDTQIGLVAGTYDYTFTLAGYSAMHIKLETLKVKGMIVTDSGATAFGTEWTQANAK